MNAIERPGISHHGRTDSTLSNASAAEDLFSSLAGFDDLAGDDDLSFDDGEDRDLLGDLDGAKKGKRLVSTAEKKATHNAVERARRESLNARFLVLADLLPGMTHVKRASKAAIVNKSIDLIKELQATEARVAKENEALKSELAFLRQRWSAQSHQAAAAAAAFNPASLAAPQMMQMQQQQPVAGLQVQQHQQMPSISPKQEVAPTPAMPAMPNFSHLFAHGFMSGLEDPARSGSASPASHVSHASSMPAPPSTAASAAANNGFAAHHSYFDGNAVTSSASPTSYTSQSPSAAVTSLPSLPSTSSSNTAPSPASTQSVQTPGNAYSPSSLPNFAADASAVARGSSSPAHGASSATPNPAVAAFDGNADPSYLASHYGPRDLAKAQQELQNFIAYQQRIAGNPSVQGSPMSFLAAQAAGLGGLFPFGAPAAPAGSPAWTSPNVANIPAWQMMMAQQAALTAYGGAAQF